MNIYSAEMRTRAEGYANESRELVINSTGELDIDDHFVYDCVELDGTTLYWAEKDGFVSYFAHSPNNEHGYGGREYTLNMSDGSVRTIKGPWSSRASVMNEYFPHCTEVCVRTPKYNTLLATNITIEFAELMASTIGAKVVRDGLRYSIEEE